MPPPAEPSRREQIVEVARDLFTTRGYDGTPVGLVASELDISKAAVSYYFPTKDTLLDEFVTPFLDALDEATSGDLGRRDMLDRYLATITAHHRVAVWFDSDPTIQNHEDYRPRLDAINERVLTTVVGGAADSADRVRALAVLGAIWRPARELSESDLSEHHELIVDIAVAAC